MSSITLSHMNLDERSASCYYATSLLTKLYTFPCQISCYWWHLKWKSDSPRWSRRSQQPWPNSMWRCRLLARTCNNEPRGNRGNTFQLRPRSFWKLPKKILPAIAVLLVVPNNCCCGRCLYKKSIWLKYCR